MGITDPIADYLTRIRNALKARKNYVDIPGSNVKREITRILFEEHYIQDYLIIEDPVQDVIRIFLKYDTEEPLITGLRRISKPGLRHFVKAHEVPRVLNNLGIAIMTTPNGVITNKTARKLGIGGEVICYVW